jgi:L-ascorbate metabolism protein UlaG (beta-lactamase superfamily)
MTTVKCGATFVITLGDIALFHTGDAEVVDIGYLQSYGLPEKQLDIAFVPYFYFTEEAYYLLLLEGIQARYLIPMHYGGRISPSERFKSLFPGYFIFTESYESWVLPPP